MSEKDFKENEDDNFMSDFEDWHSRQYSDDYRFGNKIPFFIKKPNYLIHGVLALTLPILSLIVSVILNLGIGFYLFFSLLCIPGIYQIIKHFKFK